MREERGRTRKQEGRTSFPGRGPVSFPRTFRDSSGQALPSPTSHHGPAPDSASWGRRWPHRPPGSRPPLQTVCAETGNAADSGLCLCPASASRRLPPGLRTKETVLWGLQAAAWHGVPVPCLLLLRRGDKDSLADQQLEPVPWGGLVSAWDVRAVTSEDSELQKPLYCAVCCTCVHVCAHVRVWCVCGGGSHVWGRL